MIPPFEVTLTEADVRRSFKDTPPYEQKIRGRIPKTGRWAPATLAIHRTTNDLRWEVWDSMIVYSSGRDFFDYENMIFIAVPAILKDYLNNNRKGPFSFYVDTSKILGRFI